MAIKETTEIIDIRTGATDFDLLQDIKRGLRPEIGGEKRLPTLLLYDEAGLRLFEKITYLDEYYLTNAEIEVSLEVDLLPSSRYPIGTSNFHGMREKTQIVSAGYNTDAISLSSQFLRKNANDAGIGEVCRSYCGAN